MKFTRTNDMGAHFLKILVQGQAGAGKTRLCATTGDPAETIIISAEGGLLSLRDSNLTAIEIKSQDELSDAYRWVTESDEARGIRWVCIDSLSEIAEQVLSHEKARTKDGRKAYGEMQDIMAKMIRGFRDIPGKHVYMSCKTERIQTETGALLWSPSMPGNKLSQQLAYFFDEVAFLHTKLDTEKNEVQRWLQCHPDGTFVAKDRSGALEIYETPNLEAIKTKILGDKNNG